MGDPYEMAHDAAACWKSVGRRYRRKLTAAEIGMVRAGAGAVLAEMCGDGRSKILAMGEIAGAVHAYIAEKIGMPVATRSGEETFYDSAHMVPRRRLSRRPTRIRGRRPRAERKK